MPSDARITIGVPVYNGADLIDECLACLARQTFGDFKVLVFDNASSDDTEARVRLWTARDPRFHYVRQPENKGGMVNFRDALLAADTPWFLWRADDDLSDDNYLETLLALAAKDPTCDLAVGGVLSYDLDGGRRREITPRPEWDPKTFRGRLRTLTGYPPSWFYGLWRREAALRYFLPVFENFPYAFAGDHLILYGPVIAGAVRTTTATRFHQRVRRTAQTPRRQTRMAFAQMREVRRLFRAELRRIRSESGLSRPELRMLAAFEPVYLQHVLPSILKMARTGLREWLGIAGRRRGSPHLVRTHSPSQSGTTLPRKEERDS